MRKRKCKHNLQLHTWETIVEGVDYEKKEKHNSTAKTFICTKCNEIFYIKYN